MSSSSSRRSLRPVTLAKSLSTSASIQTSYKDDPELAMALALSVVNDGKGPSPKLSLTGIKKKKRQRAVPDDNDEKIVRSEPPLINPPLPDNLLSSETSPLLISSPQQATSSLVTESTPFILNTLSSPDEITKNDSNTETISGLASHLEANQSLVEVSFIGAPDILSQEFEAIVDEEVEEEEEEEAEEKKKKKRKTKSDVILKETEHLFNHEQEGINISFTGAPDILSQEFDHDVLAEENESSSKFHDRIIDQPTNSSPHEVIDMSFSGPLDVLSQEFVPVPIPLDEVLPMEELVNDPVVVAKTSLNTSLVDIPSIHDVELHGHEATSSPQAEQRGGGGGGGLSCNKSSCDTSSATASPTPSPLDSVTLFGQALVTSLPQRPHSVRMFASQHPANSPCEDFWWAGTNADYTASSTSSASSSSSSHSSTPSPSSKSPLGLTYIFVVLDGHGGPVAASFGMMHLPKKIFEKIHTKTTALEVVTGIKEAFEEVDQMYLAKHSHDLNFCKFGSCVNLVLLRKVQLPSLENNDLRWTIFTANVGDSRSVLTSQWDVERWGKESLTKLLPQARPQLLDSRVHNRTADAAGIPSLLAAGRPFDRMIDVVKVTSECESALVSSVLERQNFGGKHVVRGGGGGLSSSSSAASEYHSKAECFDLQAKCIAYAAMGDKVSTASTASPLPIALEQRRKMLRSNHFVAIPLSVDHTCANPLEADDVKARCWDEMPIRPNILGYNPTFINRGNEGSSSNSSSSSFPSISTSSSSSTTMFSRSGSMKTSLQAAPQLRNTTGMIDLTMHRVAGSLMVTRALGDHYLKSPLHSLPFFASGCPYISSEPEVHWRVLQPLDRFALMGCDGIWDNVSNAEAVEIVALSLQNEALIPILKQLHNDLNSLRTEEEERGVVEVGQKDPSGLFNSALAALKDERLVDKIGSPIPVLLSTTSSTSTGDSNTTSGKSKIESSNNNISSESLSQTSGIKCLEDIVFGNPAQRIVGASLLVAAARHVDAARRQRHSEISIEVSVAALLAKSPKLSDPKQRDHRRGIHDDLTALVIAFPEFMIEENRIADADALARGVARVNEGEREGGGGGGRRVLLNNDSNSPSVFDESTLSSCVMEGVDSFVFPPPSTRFNKASLDAQLAMRVKSRLSRLTYAPPSVANVQPSGGSSYPSSHLERSAHALLTWLGGGKGSVSTLPVPAAAAV
jgi:serine/threonine protein phosphatase PrpC